MPQRYHDIINAIRTLPKPTVRGIADLIGLRSTQTWRLLRQMHREKYLTIVSDPNCPLKIKLPPRS
jgi:DNA-binding IclR family transcriptional regulator